ncbi:ankyrin repeat domain-containing protein [Gymnodinialimonas hymeniacidonis]|uniref:ankyrin repeat domain-containing protein n=1 Tax=Gymnodinialimonas hymeniacidonis TaxID=3126508 RepID=UPI0034C5F2ED
MSVFSLHLSALAVGLAVTVSHTASANAQCFRQSDVRLPTFESVSPNLTGGQSGEAMYQAVSQGDIAGVQSLLATNTALLEVRTGLPEGTRPYNGNSADLLTAAIAACDLPMLQALLAFGANPNGEITGLPLTYAALADDPDYATALLEAGADPNVHDPAMNTPLREAILFERADAIRLLVAGGADINHVTSNGRTPLGSAMLTGEWDVIAAVIEAGGNPWQVHGQGVLPAYTIYANEPRRRADRRIRNAILEQIEVGAPVWPPVNSAVVAENVLNGTWPTPEMSAAGFTVPDEARRAMQAAFR